MINLIEKFEDIFVPSEEQSKKFDELQKLQDDILDGDYDKSIEVILKDLYNHGYRRNHIQKETEYANRLKDIFGHPVKGMATDTLKYLFYKLDEFYKNLKIKDPPNVSLT